MKDSWISFRLFRWAPGDERRSSESGPVEAFLTESNEHLSYALDCPGLLVGGFRSRGGRQTSITGCSMLALWNVSEGRGLFGSDENG
jgi:hypothetical protein